MKSLGFKVATVSMAILTALSLAACGTSQTPTEPAGDNSKEVVPSSALLRAGELHFCISNSNYMPLYDQDKSGNLIGIVPEVAQKISESWGLKFTYERLAFAGIIPATVSGKCDLTMGNIDMTPDRLAILPAVAWRHSEYVVAFRSEDAVELNSLEDLSGMSVGLKENTSQETALIETNEKLKDAGRPPIDIQAYSDVIGAVAAVGNQKADAFVEDNNRADYLLANAGYKVKLVAGLFTPKTIGIFFKNETLKEPLETTMTKLYQDGSLELILNSYNTDPSVLIEK